MKSKIELYQFGVVSHKEKSGEGFIDLTVLTEDTKKNIILTMENRDVDVGDEVEFVIESKINGIGEEISEIKGRHNITKQAIEKAIGTLFPIEVLSQGHELGNEEWRTKRLHLLYMNFLRLEKLYQRYIYIGKYGGSVRGTRDPNGLAPFKSSKSFFDNARNINYFYNIIKAKEQILKEHQTGRINILLFESITKKFYNKFLQDIKKIPDKYQSIESFTNHLSDLKDKIGL